MKKIIKIFCLFIIGILLMSGCAKEVPKGTRAIRLYFANTQRDSLDYETCYIDEKLFESEETFAKAVMEKLFEGPKNAEHVAVIPKDTTLRGVSVSKIQNGVINIDLSADYRFDKEDASHFSDELLARYSIVCTLCQYDGIEKIKFFVNGEHMKSGGTKGEILNPISLSSIHMDSPSSVDTQTERFVTLYFTDKDGKRLYSETRKATMTDNSTEKTIVTELLRGPVSKSYARTLPEGVDLISVETTEEVCFVNLTSTFTSKLESGSVQELIAVYSIVNSVTRVPGIEKVQILIDGKKPENDVNQLYSTPLQPNTYLIAEIKS